MPSAAPSFTAVDAQSCPSWLARISPHGRVLLDEVMRHFKAGPLVLASNDQVTRQARHARLDRARSTAAAGAVLLASRSPEMRAFVLSAEFAYLRPYCADTMSKWRYLLPQVSGITPRSCERLFDESAQLFLSLASRLPQLEDLAVLQILNAVSGLVAGPLFCGPLFHARVKALIAEAERRGVLAHRVLRMRLGYLLSWTGDDSDMLPQLLDPSLEATGLGDAYLFVRSDTRDEVLRATAQLLRKGAIDPELCLLRSNPEATLVKLLDFTITRLRDSAQMRTPGYMLTMLSAVHTAREHARVLHARGVLRHGLQRVHTRLLRFERVQLMEKRRYYELFEQLPEGPARDRLAELWARPLSL
ncbi:MAG: hypothetical protein ABW321_00170 [Polyangiales bacterium]